MYSKTAKDIAFDKERVKLKSQISSLKKQLMEKDKKIATLENRIQDLESAMAEKDGWIERLLECTEMSKEELKTMIEKNKKAKEAYDMLLGMGSFMKGHY